MQSSSDCGLVEEDETILRSVITDPNIDVSTEKLFWTLLGILSSALLFRRLACFIEQVRIVFLMLNSIFIAEIM